MSSSNKTHPTITLEVATRVAKIVGQTYWFADKIYYLEKQNDGSVIMYDNGVVVRTLP